MQIEYILSSLSRNGGGVFTSALELASKVERHSGMLTRLTGLSDCFTNEDLQDFQGSYVAECRPSFGGYFGFSRDLGCKLRESWGDILHLHGLWQYSSLLLANRANNLGRPYVVSPHGMLDSWALSNSRYRKLAVWGLWEKRLLSNASCLHALTEQEYIAIRECGITTPVCIIPNGVSIPNGDYFNNTRNNISSLSIPRKILYLGRIHQKKGIFELVEAWSLIKSHFGSHTPLLTIAGWGDEKDIGSLERQIQRLGLQGHCNFLGPKFGNEKSQLMSEADFFILPSRSEGLPIAVLEAWSHGTPVIISKACNLNTAINRGFAFEVKPTIDSIFTVMTKVMSIEPEQRKLMAQESLNFVRENFSWDSVAVEFYKVYQWLLGLSSIPSTVRLTNETI